MLSDLVHINFCRPIINNKVEERTCGNGPNLADIFEDDAEIINVAQSVHVRERRREGGEGEDIGEIEGERVNFYIIIHIVGCSIIKLQFG